MESKEIVNRVANSGLVTMDLAEWIDEQAHASLDIAPWLFHNLILKEKDFRASVDAHDWTQYAGQHISIYLSADAIIPLWAFLLIGGKLSEVNATAFYGTEQQTFTLRCREIIRKAVTQKIEPGTRLIVKGCNKYEINPDTFLYLAEAVRPLVKTLMYGEACSTVPIYKNKTTPMA